MKNQVILITTALIFFMGSISSVSAGQVRNTNVYWGDTHLHTCYSADAYLMKNETADPDTAYRYAKGLPVVHPYHRAKIQIETPLDFLAVTDHGEFMGVFNKLAANDPVIVNTETGKRFRKMFEEGKGKEVFFELIKAVNENKPFADLDTPVVRTSIWSEIIAAADRHNEPGKFTTFIGWEWTSLPNGANLHRVVFIREDGSVAKEFSPYTSFDSDRPEDLWQWLGTTSASTGANFVAIPHNSNVSKGLMFALQDSNGKPITTKYAQERMRWEPVVEVTQIKGDSETHPAFSPNDEFADFETYTHLLDPTAHGEYKPEQGDYVRSGLKRGLEIETKVGKNPYKFGLIGSTDSHTAMVSAEENNFHGKVALDSIPENKELEITPGSVGYDMSASGLAAVWAEENTREAIFDAFRRKEVYGTTGPRIQVRFFGGWDYSPEDAYASNLAEIGYQKGVPMGGDLTRTSKEKSPTFLVAALKDPNDANLDRIQVVKGWEDKKGELHEKVYNVALSDGRKERFWRKVKPVGNTVDLKTATYTNTIGDAQLVSVWTDPDFDPDVHAFYYVRVLQIPTPRHTLYDAVALRKDPPEGYPATIQERAYTSPIWYTPNGS
jgi:hypothetical protein